MHREVYKEAVEVAVFNFHRWARATKIKCDENLTDEMFLTQKFPALRYVIIIQCARGGSIIEDIIVSFFMYFSHVYVVLTRDYVLTVLLIGLDTYPSILHRRRYIVYTYTTRDEAIMLIFLPIMLFPNAPYYVQLCSFIFRLCSYMFQLCSSIHQTLLKHNYRHGTKNINT